MRILLLTILFVSPAAAQSWIIETSSIEASNWNSNLRAVSATHARNPERHPAPVIWAAGSNSRVLRSTDGGNHYSRLLVNGDRVLDLHGIQAFNEKITYVMSTGPEEDVAHLQDPLRRRGLEARRFRLRPQFSLDALVCISENEMLCTQRSI